MSAYPTLASQPEAPPVFPLFPLHIPPVASPAPEAIPASGARQLSRWEELEETWLPEARDLSHSGINE